MHRKDFRGTGMRYFVGFILSIVLIILLVVTLAGGGGSNSNKSKVPTSSKPLQNYSTTNAEVVATIDGPVNAPEVHQRVRISVNKDQITYQQLKGYNGDVVNQQTYANTPESYANFLRALSVVGFTRGDIAKNLANEQGYCPANNRYIFELTQDGKDIQRFWSTDCGKPKSYLGQTQSTLNLFKAQVPNYEDLTQELSL